MTEAHRTEDQRIIDYLDKPPQRYDLVAARNERGVIELTEPNGKWVKFADMDLYMFEGSQLMMQSLRENQALRGEVGRLQAELKEATRCKHPTKRGTGSVSSDGKIVTSELWCDTCGEKLT